MVSKLFEFLKKVLFLQGFQGDIGKGKCLKHYLILFVLKYPTSA